MSTKYFELLRRPEWQKRRLQKLEAAGWACEKCFDKENTLNVHHKRYRKGHKPWEYEDFELEVLCEPCHLEAHELHGLVSDVITRVPVQLLEEVANLIAGWCPGYYMDDVMPALSDAHALEVGSLARAASTLPITEIMELTKSLDEARVKKFLPKG